MATLNIMDFGAHPEDADSTNAIQLALNAGGLEPGSTVWVPPAGEFMIDALKSVQVRSNTIFKIDGGLRAIPTRERDYVVVDVNSVNGITISGSGYIAGERYQHLPTNELGRHGLCLRIINSNSVRVTGNHLVLKEAFADGLYLQQSEDVTIGGLFCTDNARNACSLISGKRVNIVGNTFQLTHSEDPYPQAGIDIEPDQMTDFLLDIGITQNLFVKNKGAGVYVALGNSPNCHRIYVVNNQFDQHYKDYGPPIRGVNDQMGWFLYSTCRWIPGYDWWAFPTSYTKP